MKLEDIREDAYLRGIMPHVMVKVVSVKWMGSEALALTYEDLQGRLDRVILYRGDEARLELIEEGLPWHFDGDGALFRLVSEAYRIRLAYLFDPLAAVHASIVEPLPHQITAVYEKMLPRQPLRFLLADDPGAGKTIMAGLLIKELLMRGDVHRCLIVCPGNLVEQWQDELQQRFQLPFEILTSDKLEAARTGNWFLENNLAIVRLDKAARDETLQTRLTVPECRWDLVVIDEAHKMSATFFGGEVKYTKRYKLGQLLSRHTRHLLLLTATPHNGKEADFQLFLALLDEDRFEGRFRDGVHEVDVSDLMRRMVKEHLIKFDGQPLFPERYAYTVAYRLSESEARLYQEVTDYVREEFNRADALGDEKRKGTVGFALTILQRRLASSPEAIYQSLRRRRERLEKRLKDLAHQARHGKSPSLEAAELLIDPEELEEWEETPESERTQQEEVLDQATAARTLQELQAEIDILKHLEGLAQQVRARGEDRKWQELAGLLRKLLEPPLPSDPDHAPTLSKSALSNPPSPPPQKLVIFTEHRDTLNYLTSRIATLLGSSQAVVCMHGGMSREERRQAQEAFLHDPEVRVLIATDAAGEGINLQRAHLMINYDLPWNPNRIEQRFGRIHRIGQTEPCYLWNLVAIETREGDVYYALLKKIEEARQALGGKVFDVLGKLQFEGRPLRELLLEAIRYGERPDVTAKLHQAIDEALNIQHLQNLVEERALVQEILQAEQLQRLREDMARAAARRLQPHYVEAFFLEAFSHLGGSAQKREPGRYEITRVPDVLSKHPRTFGIRKPLLRRYERITFEKERIAPPGQAQADFLCPGHPLLDTVVELTLERHRNLLRQGAILVDDNDPTDQPRLIIYLEHAIRDAMTTPTGEPHVISRRMIYIEMRADGHFRNAAYAPYLDYRPLRPEEPAPQKILTRPECAWIVKDIERRALEYASTGVVCEHLEEVRRSRLERIEKTRAAVKERLTKEIAYWDWRAEELRLEEQAGKPNARLNSQEARRRAEELKARLEKRMAELDLEAQIMALPPVVVGGFIVVPAGLLAKMQGQAFSTPLSSTDTQAIAARARTIVMEAERQMGYDPRDLESEHLGYDIESYDPRTGRLRLIEVKGRIASANTITFTRNEILTALNKPDVYLLAIVTFDEEGRHHLYYVRPPFSQKPDFGVTSVDYSLTLLLSQAEKVL